MFDILSHLFLVFSVWFTIAYFGSKIFSEKAHPVFRSVCTWLLIILGIAVMVYSGYQRKLHPEFINQDDPPEMNDESDGP
jgi:formate-dependent nitrite reductase membrane component NrfD